MSTISIANQAGSAGKTTTAVTLAALLAGNGLEVLLIDLDAQANASFWLGVADPEGPTSGDVLVRRVPLAEAIVATAVPGLRLVPSTPALDSDAVELGRALGGEQRLRLALESCAPPDVTLIDCPGSLSILTVAALVAGDAVVTVAQPTVKELAGLPRLEATVEDVRAAYNPKLTLAAVIPCIVPPPSSGSLYSEALVLLRDSYGDQVTPPIRRSVRIPEAYSRQVPLTAHAPREPVTEDYRTVLAHLTSRGTLP